MNDALKIVLSLSISGSFLILILLLMKPFFKDRVSRQWQYYIWLIIIARLLLPFAPKANFVGTIFQEIEQYLSLSNSDFVSQDILVPQGSSQSISISASKNIVKPSLDLQGSRTVQKIGATLFSSLWFVWLGTALILLVRKITIYQSFVKYIEAGSNEVSDIEVLNHLAEIGESIGIRQPIELYTNHLIASPMLFGFFHPFIVLPTIHLPKIDFEYTIQHELIHYKRRDIFYKWLVQFITCLHWFNPLVWLMSREINRNYELSCDEVVISTLDIEGRQAYGDTLIHAMGAGGDYKNSLASITLNESTELLKERLKAIMNYKKTSKLVVAMTFMFTIFLAVDAQATGAYVKTVNQNSTIKGENTAEFCYISEENYELTYLSEIEWQAKNIDEYMAYGITKDDTTYYYQSQPIHIFLDHQRDSSLFALDMNPQGIVDIKVIRDINGKIEGVTYMTEEEVTELLRKMEDSEYDMFPFFRENDKEQIIPINFANIESNEAIWLGEYELSYGDHIQYDVSAEIGEEIQMGFVLAGGEMPNTLFYFVSRGRKDGILKCTENIIFSPPVKPGRYQLFLKAADGGLGNVSGKVVITVPME